MALKPELLDMIKGAKNKFSRGSKAIKLKEGKTVLRLLAREGEKFWAENGVHWIKTEVNGKPVAVVGCSSIVKDEPCEICTAIDRASKAATDDDTSAVIKEWKAKPTILINALIRKGADASPDPQVVELTTTTFGKMLAIIEEYEANHGINMLDPDTGLDFVVERSGRGLNTEYTVIPLPKPIPFDRELLDRLHDLSEFIEKEYFRGDEPKALRAIGSMMGFSMPTAPALTGGAKAPALAGPGTTVEGAYIDSVIEEMEEADPSPKTTVKSAAAKPAAKPAAKTAPAGTLPQEDIDALLAEIDGIS